MTAATTHEDALPRRAAIDIGSNSAHLLVADLERDGHGLVAISDESVFLGLGEQVAATGHLGDAARARTVEAIRVYVDAAVGLGADRGRLLLLGTEPVRRAADAARLVIEVEAATGRPLLALSHGEEGWLNLLGVTGGRRIERPLAVVDSGGGSTEVVVARPEGGHDAHGLRLGSASLTAAFIRSDPPSPAETAALRREIERIVAGLPSLRAADVVGVGGTTSNLAKVVPGALEDRRLTRRRLDEVLAMLLETPAAVLRERHGLNPRRAPLLVAGAVIIEVLLERLGADELTVSEAGLREGALLAQACVGAGWRDRLTSLVHGWEPTRRT